MPIIKSAIKRMHQTAKRRTRNLTTKRDFKEAVKAFRAKPSAANLSKAQSAFDIAVKKNLLKTGTAARRKAQLAKEAKAAGVKLASASKKKVVAPTKAAPKKTVAKKKPTTKPTTKAVPAKTAKKSLAKKKSVAKAKK